MPMHPKAHAALITDPAGFLEDAGLDPEAHFIDHHGRTKPLVVRHEDGIPTHTVEDDGTLAPYEPKPNPDAPAAEVNVQAEGDPAEFANG